MKKIFVLLVLGVGIIFWFREAGNPVQNVVSLPSPTPVTSETSDESDRLVDFEKDGLAYRAAFVKTADFKNLFLYPNFTEKLSAQEIFDQKKCQGLVSAGFYTKEGEPVGLFVSEGKNLKKAVQSRLFDGVFSVDEAGKPEISWAVPRQNLRLALQSGPVLIKDREEKDLEIKDDGAARRVVLALTESGEAVFLIIFNRDSVLEGPFLASLPEVVKTLEVRMGEEFTDAINLDGGSASAFYTDFFSLSEFSLIGSYFCIKF